MTKGHLVGQVVVHALYRAGKTIFLRQLQAAAGESLAVTALPPESHLFVYAGKRHLNMKPAEWEGLGLVE